jgi:hypothetical protein
METPYEGHVRALRADSQFLGAEDLLGVKDDTPFQVVGVFRDQSLSIGGGKPKDSFYLKLRDRSGRDCAKKLLINAHRRKMLGIMYGGSTAEWKDKWVWVYVEEVRNPSGGMTLGLRFRNRKDAPKQTLPQPPATKPADHDPIGEQFEKENPQ